MENSRYTVGVCDAIKKSKLLADKFKINYVGTEEILYGLLTIPNSGAYKSLIKYGVNKNTYFAHLQRTFSRNYDIGDFTPQAKGVLNDAGIIAERMGKDYVSTEHLLLAILQKKDCKATSIIMNMGVDYSALIGEVRSSVERSDVPESAAASGEGSEDKTEKKEEKEPTPLDKFGFDLTKKAREGKLDPVIGRGDEIERVIQSLSRRMKNSPVLIGDPGVGKSAVVEGLAIEIAKGSVPETLRDKIIFSVSLSGMLAGTKYRGEFEQRFKEAIDYVIAQGNIILFIDEIHNIMGAGNSGDGNMDLADMLKPILARGEIQTIGATTIDEFRKYIEPDPAMARRFQPITVDAPDPESAILILRGLKDKYEAHHGVVITDEAIKAAVNLSNRYITDRNLPDKAIDLIDEAAAKARLKYCYTPKQYTEYIEQLKRLINERNYLRSISRTEEMRRIESQIDDLKEKIEEIDERQREARSNSIPSIGENDVAEVISEWTKIPLTKISEEESVKLLGLEDELRGRVIGQDGAINAVSKAIKRARANIKDPNRPIGTFIFVGPTGVGKTELSKALADVVFGDKDSLIRIDMSEYMDKASVSKLIGAPPGYVGYEEAGILTDKVRRKPYSVVLFDEIEKANPEIFNIMLQIFDDGRLSDSKGKVVDFKNTIIILTSNVGAHEVKASQTPFYGNREREEDELKDRIYSALKLKFSPEFLNRLDDIIIFRHLSEEDCSKIADLMLEGLKKRLKEQSIDLRIAASASDLIIRKGYDEFYGARPLRRAIQRNIEDVLSEEIIAGRIKRGNSVTVYAENGRIRLDVQ